MSRPTIFQRLHRRLDARERKGIETYGETLRADNGRNPGTDLIEELLDAAAYAEQVEEVIAGLRADNERLREALLEARQAILNEVDGSEKWAAKDRIDAALASKPGGGA